MNSTFYSARNTRRLTGFLFLAMAVLMVFPIEPGAQSREQSEDKFRKRRDAVAGRYIVVLRDDSVDPAVRQKAVADIGVSLAAAYGGRIERTFKHAINGYAMRMTGEQALALSRDPRVEFVEEDGEVYATSEQSYPVWGLDRIDQRDLPLDEAYKYNSTGSSVNAYVLDSGIRATHDEFEERVIPAFDSIGDGMNAGDCRGHGTHVAGTIGGKTYGVAKAVTLHSVRVLNCNGKGTWSGVVAGIDWVTANHIKPAVANMSLGGGINDAVDRAVRNSIAAGVTYVVSAGNDGLDALNYSPARVSEAITVGATMGGDARWSYSNYGSIVDIFAPGAGVVSSVHHNDYATDNYSGTSMASPHVAGVVALYLQRHPNASPAEVTEAILDSATPRRLTDPGEGSPNLILYSGLQDDNDPCPACEVYAGSLRYGSDANFQPNGSFYFSEQTGLHKGWLHGPADADFDLYLWRWNSWFWVVVAKSESETSEEQITFNGLPGYYSWRIYSYSGSGGYRFQLQRP